MVDDRNWTNVHTFDSQLQGVFFPQHLSSKKSKLELFEKLESTLTNPSSKIIVNQIIEDLQEDRRVVHDGIEQTDILFEICMVFDKGDMTLFKEFEEQLADTQNSGTCPSGRVTRMFQVWRSMYGIVQDEDFREKIRRVNFVYIDNRRKLVLFSKLLRSVHHTKILHIIKDMVVAYQNGKLVYYDGIEQSNILGNVCLAFERNGRLFYDFVEQLEKFSKDEKANPKEIYMTMVEILLKD